MRPLWALIQFIDTMHKDKYIIGSSGFMPSGPFSVLPTDEAGDTRRRPIREVRPPAKTPADLSEPVLEFDLPFEVNTKWRGRCRRVEPLLLPRLSAAE
jgi:hypothetical protein